MRRAALRAKPELLAALLILLPALPAAAQSSGGAEVVERGAYPELHVDGAPFFVHAATFFYYRIPRDLWETSLERYRELGINTIDLPIPWNWHELREGEFDFDGRTNPRRDLRGLLKSIAEKELKLIARPGPIIGSQWRNGGYPDWLLARPEYKMDAAARRSGLYPPAAVENSRDAEAAAKAWLENQVHMTHARKWLAVVAGELAAYSSRRKLRVTVPAEKTGEPQEKEISGPLLLVQPDDSPALSARTAEHSYFARYVAELRSALEAGGLDVQYTVNPPGLLESGWGATLGASTARPIGVTGQWFLASRRGPSDSSSGQRELTEEVASELELQVETLGTQPAFPALLSDYQAGWYAPGDDVRPRESSPANTLLSSRLLIAHGLHGLDYYPLQDTLTPAGYETPAANRYFRWDAALDLSGNSRPRARGVGRNGALLRMWGTWLAASHKRVDFGLVDPRGALENTQDPHKPLEPEEIRRFSRALMQVERVTQLASLSDELLNPALQPVEALLRNGVALLPVFNTPQDGFELSERAQGVLVEYVRRGGTLVYFPTRPSGKILEELWRSAPASVDPRTRSVQAAPASWRVGQGRVVEWSKDFYSWAALEESSARNRARFEAAWATESLRAVIEQAGVQPVMVKGSGKGLLVTELVANEGTGPFGARPAGCAQGALCREGLLSVTNLSPDEPLEETLEILSPRAGARDPKEAPIQLHLLVPAGESLLLPLHHPLCSGASSEKCDDEIVVAGAELLRAERDGQVLELTFYNPARSTMVLKLEDVPKKIMLEEMNLVGNWIAETRQLELSLPRGASPDFIRVLRIRLHYTPHLPQKPELEKDPRRGFDTAVADAVRLPLSEDATLLTEPPLVLLRPEGAGQLLMRADNHDGTGRQVSVKIEGAVQGSGRLVLGGKDVRFNTISLNRDKNPAANEDAATTRVEGLLRGELAVHSGHADRKSPIYFVVAGENFPAHYQFDFDRDGAKEWALETQHIRLILSPEDGGRAIALVDKASGANLTTSVGALRDLLVIRENSSEGSPERDLTFNQNYQAEWVREPKAPQNSPAVRLSYKLPFLPEDRNSLGGASIEKTVRLTGPDGLEVDYRLALPAAGAAASIALVSMNSVPTHPAPERGTNFCWQGTERHCEPFTPDGAPLVIPDGVRELEVRSLGSAGLALEWTGGTVTVEMKRFSALLKLHFPALEVGEPVRYQVRYTLLPTE